MLEHPSLFFMDLPQVFARQGKTVFYTLGQGTTLLLFPLGEKNAPLHRNVFSDDTSIGLFFEDAPIWKPFLTGNAQGGLVFFAFAARNFRNIGGGMVIAVFTDEVFSL